MKEVQVYRSMGGKFSGIDYLFHHNKNCMPNIVLVNTPWTGLFVFDIMEI